MAQGSSGPPPAARRRRVVKADVVADPACQVHWNHWPAPEIPLTILGQAGFWSFCAPFPCGSQEFVLLTPYAQRDEPDIERQVVVISDLRLPAPQQAPTRSTTKGVAHAKVRRSA